MSARYQRWLSFALVVLLGSALAAVPAVRVLVLGQAGSILVAQDPLERADVIAIAVDAGGAGVLEAADLVRQGLAARVAVLAGQATEEDREFRRRGIADEDAAQRSVRQLALLGVRDVERLAEPVSGTSDTGPVISDWCDARGFGSIIVVTSSSHSRRLRRVLSRAFRNSATTVMVRVSRYSDFDPNSWWETRSGIRTEIVELQKLILDVVTHPIPTFPVRSRAGMDRGARSPSSGSLQRD